MRGRARETRTHERSHGNVYICQTIIETMTVRTGRNIVPASSKRGFRRDPNRMMKTSGRMKASVGLRNSQKEVFVFSDKVETSTYLSTHRGAASRINMTLLNVGFLFFILVLTEIVCLSTFNPHQSAFKFNQK